MAQIRFHNYQRPLVSFDENLRGLGAIHPGRICGFDTMAIVGGNTLSVAHTAAGLINTNLDGTAHAIRGVVQSRQGNFIHEDAAIQVNVDYNVGNANDRIDILVMEHTFLNAVGGAPAVYSIIKGVLTGAQEPVLSNALTQVLIGKFLIKAGAGDHVNTVYEPVDPKILGGASAVVKFNGEDIQDASSIINPGRVVVGAQTLADFNRLTKSGMFAITTTLNRPTTATNVWLVLVMKRGNQVVQLALDKLTGKTYTRSSQDIGATWQAWRNLNPSDLTGDLIYTSNNYIVDGEDLTVTASKLDAAIAAASGGLLTSPDFNIGNWNMDITLSVNIATGIVGSKIREVEVLIRTNDLGAGAYNVGPLYLGGYYVFDSATGSLDIFRTAAGPFDAVGYNQVGGWNRGTVRIKYLP